MAIYYNSVGSQVWTGTANVADLFYLYTRSGNQNDLRVDVVFPSLVWTTSLHSASDTLFQLTGTNVNASVDIVNGEGADSIKGSNGNDLLVYNNGAINDGIGGFTGVQNFSLGNGNDLVDFTAHGPGGGHFAKDIKLYAEGGNDIIISGAGDDLIYGQDGDDFIVGFGGLDKIYGGAGNDIIYGDDLGF